MCCFLVYLWWIDVTWRPACSSACRLDVRCVSLLLYLLIVLAAREQLFSNTELCKSFLPTCMSFSLCMFSLCACALSICEIFCSFSFSVDNPSACLSLSSSGWVLGCYPSCCLVLKAIVVNTLSTCLSSLVYPSTARVVGAPQMISQQVSSIFPCSPLPSGTWRTPGLSIPWYCLHSLPLSALSSYPFHYALQHGFGQTWWAGDMTIPLQFASLYNGQGVFVWSNCLLDLISHFLVGNMVFVWDAFKVKVTAKFQKDMHTIAHYCTLQRKMG